MNVGIINEAAQFHFWEYMNRILVTVRSYEWFWFVYYAYFDLVCTLPINRK